MLRYMRLWRIYIKKTHKGKKSGKKRRNLEALRGDFLMSEESHQI